MIKVDRGDPPNILVIRGAAAADTFRAQYDAGKRSFTFDSTIYGDETVKQTLLRAQADKCCFCEAKITHIDFGDIEHFRPKAEVSQSDRDSVLTPGYYWLAYSWDNLLVCCAVCNRRHKRKLFPLFNPDVRARTHHADLAAEQPCFISPADEDPILHLSFRKEVAHAVRNSVRGQITIHELGLNREALLERRRDHLAHLERDLMNHALHTKTLARLREYCPNNSEIREHLQEVEKEIQNLQASLEGSLLATSEYTAMNRAVLRSRRLGPIETSTDPA